MKLLSFKQAVLVVQGCDLIILQGEKELDRTIATFVGWEEEGDPESDFVVGADGWDDIYIPYDQKIIREGNVLKIPGYTIELHLYTAKK